MHIRLNESNFSLPYTMIMGKIDLDVNQPLSISAIEAKAQEYADAGASFIEFKVMHPGCNCASDCDCDCENLGLVEKIEDIKGFKAQEQELLKTALSVVKAKCPNLILAVCTSDPNLMAFVHQYGAQIIVDPLALRAQGATQIVSKLNLVVLMCFDQSREFVEESDLDPCAAVSEFFYERLDACMNAKIDRQRIILDPMLSVKTSVDYRLKMIGRLKTIASFGLPLSCELPRFAMEGEEEESGLSHNLAVSTAVALFAEQQGIKIIRTRRVEDIALALDTWQALNLSARPFKLTRLIAKTFKGIAKSAIKPKA